MKSTLIYVGYVSSEPTHGTIPKSTPARPFLNFDVVENIRTQGGEVPVWRHVRVYGTTAQRYIEKGLPKGSVVQIFGREIFRIEREADGTPKIAIDFYADEILLVKRADTVKVSNGNGQEHERDLEYASAG